ncbi:DUF4328 domain-containing protein [Nocardia macrotermitis]|uniref:DUF4328 domain-containing protein n=1 Tax=Nocardia macrotermitis TaxID=2585198 RepID=A0A7K0D9B5_9NOCA|nr:DUF4328 domain-containing protein [Nocardia macrotermitis]MQY22317.1 hypothetical protein [Nocardia macrotermitis]
MTDGRLRGLKVPAAIVSVLVAATVIVHLYWCVRIWMANKTVVDQGESVVSVSRGGIARIPYAISMVGWLLAVMVIGVGLIIWLWLARANAETLCTARHSLSRGWTIGAWFIPLGSLVMPPILVDDVVRVSDPATPADRADLAGIPRSGLVWSWWIAWFLVWVSVVVEVATRLSTERFDVAVSPDDFDRKLTEISDAWTHWALAYTVETLLFGLAGALLITILVRVDSWQTKRTAFVPPAGSWSPTSS